MIVEIAAQDSVRLEQPVAMLLIRDEQKPRGFNRARRDNYLARFHYMTPRFDRIAVVREETEFENSGMVYTRPDWTNFDFGTGGLRYPGGLHSAHAGEKLPIAKIPEGIAFKPGDESAFAVRGDFYRCQYGRYLIGMNTTTNRTFELNVPKNATALVGAAKVGPRSTSVIVLTGE